MGEFSDGFINGRNALLLLTALTSFKHSFGLISIGIHSGTNYVDCNTNFVNQLQNIFDLYCDGQLIIDAPFLNWTKPQIWNFCIEKGVPIHLTYSCERVYLRLVANVYPARILKL